MYHFHYTKEGYDGVYPWTSFPDVNVHCLAYNSHLTRPEDMD